MAGLPDYAELHCRTNFSFLRGASHPEELVARAARLGYRALAITDECSLAGVVRAHGAAREHRFELLIGSELVCDDGLKLVLLATDRASYARLSGLITRARRRADKGSYRLHREDLADGAEGCLALWLPGRAPQAAELRWLAPRFAGRLWIAVELLAQGDDRARLASLSELGRQTAIPLVAAGDVHMHVRARRALQDVLTAIRHRVTVAEAGYALFPSGERHLRDRRVLAARYPAALLAETLRVAERCRFSLNELHYVYPAESLPPGCSAADHLRRLTCEGMRRHWPQGVPPKVEAQVRRELALIRELGYEAYFLTVHDIVRFARERGILCQGRGSAANSAVCFCLGITSVDPARSDLLLERFISRSRNEPPDIDVDFEHQRREEVIQYIYRKYGRERAALAATVITYQPRSAIRDVGKALGVDGDTLSRLAAALDDWSGGREQLRGRLREAGMDARAPWLRLLLVLVQSLLGFPRHLSQHVGGFVISAEPLSSLVPIENAALPERTVIQWDKDDLESLGMLKVDVLGLGMLSCLRRSFDLIDAFRGHRWTLATLPPEDPAVYDMICRADTVGVFQIESRAQMAMLPRMRPRSFYDLVIEVALVRPGPIQGDMVHPYLRRRCGEEAVTYPGPEVRAVLERTLGVPIFQEQAMRLAIVAAGFSADEADRLRRAMGAWRRRGGLLPFQRKLLAGMRARGYDDEFALRIYRQIEGFGEYGFPESHAASFALLVYVSAWLKCHEPAAFFCALLNSLPMGFYGPAQLLRSARESGVEVRPVDVTASEWECGLERTSAGEPALRLGLCRVKGLARTAGERLVAARRGRPFAGVQDLAARAALSKGDLGALAFADALRSLAGHRHRARWEAAAVEPPRPLLPVSETADAEPLLASPSEGQDIVADYASTGASLRRHPLALLRPRLRESGAIEAQELSLRADGSTVHAAGLVINRQRPGSARGTIFVTLEDETGWVQVVVHPALAERQRRELIGSRLLAVRGRLQRRGEVIHLLAGTLIDRSPWLGSLRVRSRDFR